MNSLELASKIAAANPFKGAASLIVRKLLLTPEREWTGVLLAKELGLSEPWCNRVLCALEHEHIVERGKRGLGAFTQLVDAKLLLRQWATLYRWKKNKCYSVVSKEKNPLAHLVAAATQENWTYAATGATALRLMGYDADSVGTDTIFLSPPLNDYHSYRSLLETLQKKYGFHRVAGSADLQIVQPFLGKSVYFDVHTHQGIDCVSPLQLYLDFMGMDGGEGMSHQLKDFWRKNNVPVVD